MICRNAITGSLLDAQAHRAFRDKTVLKRRPPSGRKLETPADVIPGMACTASTKPR